MCSQKAGCTPSGVYIPFVISEVELKNLRRYEIYQKNKLNGPVPKTIKVAETIVNRKLSIIIRKAPTTVLDSPALR
jgi:hypothetical protein